MTNMKIWEALKTTDPKYTKKVTFGRQFTSINSQYQLQRMTEQFGPIGEGWGYSVVHGVERLHEWYVLAVADVTIWWGENCTYGPVRGSSPVLEPMRNKGVLMYEADGKTVRMMLDDDAGKKAMTDALTKGLSHLGLSADVFLGLFDDNKYVATVAAQFKDAPIEAVDPADRELVQGDGAKSQYDVNKHKEALKFVREALDLFGGMTGSADINEWMATAITPGGKSTNGHKVDRLKEAFPDLGKKLDAAANEVRLRTGARLQ